MPEFEHTQRISAPPDAVFAFVSDVGNLPRYVPTTKAAQPAPGGRVRVQGEAQGQTYDSDGYFRADESAHRIEWGSDEGDYSGFLDIRAAGGGASELTVHLAFGGGMPERVEAEQQAKGHEQPSGAPPSPPQVQEGLEAALRSIQNVVEGRGGKEEPASVQPTG